MDNLMIHRVSVWRPVYVQGTADKIDKYTRVYSSVPAFIQPVDTKLQMFYAQNGTAITHTIYTTATSKTFQREDILEDASGNQFHLVAAPKDALMSQIYFELQAEQYPEGAKRRLDREAYQ